MMQKNMLMYACSPTAHNLLHTNLLLDTPLAFNELFDRRAISGNGKDLVYFVPRSDLITLK